jgi:hypothetical protein
MRPCCPLSCHALRHHLGHDASLRLGLDPASARVPFTEGLRLAYLVLVHPGILFRLSLPRFFRSLFMVIHLRHIAYLIPFIKDCTEPRATSYPIVVFLLCSLRESVAFHEGLLVHELYFVLHCTPRFTLRCQLVFVPSHPHWHTYTLQLVSLSLFVTTY